MKNAMGRDQKRTIYVGRELSARMDNFDLNWSEVAQKAFRKAIEELEWQQGLVERAGDIGAKHAESLW